MVDDGEIDALVPERVWQEVARGLMDAQPSRMFQVLRDCGALTRLFPEIDRLFGVPQPPEHHPEIDTGVHTMLVVDWAARQGFSLPVRFAALTHDLGKGVTPPGLWPRHHGHEAKSAELVRALSERIREIEQMRLAADDLTVSLKEFLILPEDEKHRSLAAFCEEVKEKIGALEGCVTAAAPQETEI